MKVLKLYFLIAMLALGSCIGTDVLDDEIRPAILLIDQPDGILPLLVGNSAELSVEFTNEFGVDEEVMPEWVMEDEAIATVDSGGIVTGVSRGQTFLFARHEGVTSNMILVNVSTTADEVNKVLIESPKEALQIGEVITLSATAWNINEMLIENNEVTWEVDDETLAMISDQGELTALGEGEVLVIATIDGVQSAPFSITIGSTTKTATFSGRSGYKASGTALLYKDESGDVILELSNDFDTDFALGTFIYLSNDTGGQATRSAGLEIAEIKSDGAAVFNISEIDSAVDLDSYRYVIVLCKPASITFGVADFNS